MKPFGKHQKNDRNDAKAICIAMRQPNMKFVPTKNEEQQDIQALPRILTRLVNHRTALVSQMGGLLLDRGAAIGVSISRARRAIPVILADQANGLTAMTREIITELYDFLARLTCGSKLSTAALRRSSGRMLPASASRASVALVPKQRQP